MSAKQVALRLMIMVRGLSGSFALGDTCVQLIEDGEISTKFCAGDCEGDTSDNTRTVKGAPK